jgi:pimeloyl-ACP methyl ester carboxylesterase
MNQILPHGTQRGEFLGHVRHDFMLGETACTVVEPTTPMPGQRWVWRAEFFTAFPAFLETMLKRGWWVGHMNVGNTFGCPDAMDRFDVFYREMTGSLGFHRHPVLEGLSRGGLYVYNWAARNPDKVGLIYGDNPVCDFKSWPGGKGQGPGSPDDWRELLRCYGFDSEAEALAWPGNPIDNLDPIVRAGIPMVHVYGDADELVPWEENTGRLAERVRALGGDITLFRKPGGRHHPHGPEDAEAFAKWVLVHALNGEPVRTEKEPCVHGRSTR